MRDMEIDLMTNPIQPILWVKGKPIQRYGWNKVKAYQLISDAGFGGRKKQSAIDFYKEYGVPAATCAKYLNNGLIRMSLGAVKGHEQLCYRGRVFSPVRTIAVCDMYDELEQAVKDGNKNITPFIAQFKKTPKELKEYFGSAVWKAVCKNTFTRNRNIAQSFNQSIVKIDRTGKDTAKEDVKSILNIPSGILKSQNLVRDPHLYAYLNKKCGIPIAKLNHKNDDATLKANIVRDTCRMASAYNQNFSYDWTWRKMQEKHEEFSRLANRAEAERRKAESEKYSKVLREGKTKLWTYNGVEARFLDTYDAILDEGTKMHHCVGGYATSCYNDSYAVVHLSGDGEETTLGIYISNVAVNTMWNNEVTERPKRHYSLNQHYGVVNAQVVSENHKFLADIVIESLNEEVQNDELSRDSIPETA